MTWCATACSCPPAPSGTTSRRSWRRPSPSPATHAWVAGDGEGLLHDLRLVVPDGAGGQLHAVAHHVILVGEDIFRLHGVERFEAALRHGKGAVREVDLLLVLVPLEHGK